jgi:hypothetical protein
VDLLDRDRESRTRSGGIGRIGSGPTGTARAVKGNHQQADISHRFIQLLAGHFRGSQRIQSATPRSTINQICATEFSLKFKIKSDFFSLQACLRMRRRDQLSLHRHPSDNAQPLRSRRCAPRAASKGQASGDGAGRGAGCRGSNPYGHPARRATSFTMLHCDATYCARWLRYVAQKQWAVGYSGWCVVFSRAHPRVCSISRRGTCSARRGPEPHANISMHATVNDRHRARAGMCKHARIRARVRAYVHFNVRASVRLAV